MTSSQYQQALEESMKGYQQMAGSFPAFEGQLRQQVYGQNQVLPKLRQTRDDAIMELWEADKRLAERYANPESEMFIRDPYAREKLVAGQHQDLFGQLAGHERLIQSQEDLLGDILNRGTQIFELGLRAKEKEFDMLSKLLDKQLAKEKASRAGEVNLQSLMNQILGAKAGAKDVGHTVPLVGGGEVPSPMTRAADLDLPPEAQATRLKVGQMGISDVQPYLQQLAAQLIAQTSKGSRSDIEAVLELMGAGEQETVPYTQGFVEAGIAGQPRVPEVTQRGTEYFREIRKKPGPRIDFNDYVQQPEVKGAKTQQRIDPRMEILEDLRLMPSNISLEQALIVLKANYPEINENEIIQLLLEYGYK